MTGDAAGATAFSVLGDPVQEALTERGFTTPTEPQRLAIPSIARGEDTLVVAPTGTGKTETAMLPVLDAITPRFGLSALYITPLRALNRDMLDRLEWWGDHLGVEVAVRHGDTSDYERRQQATDPPDVLITTPETLQAMFTGERLREALEDIEHVVIDEIHELAASKRGAQLTVALERLRALAGPFQRVGLSATVGDPDAIAAFLTGDRGATVREVDVGSRLAIDVQAPTPTDADDDLAGELMIDTELASHIRAIRELVREHESTLIFVNTRQTAEALGSRFTQLEAVDIGVHHGSLAKAARIEVEEQFKRGDLDGLLCTSSMELGIDVGHVDHVIQYASPRQVTRLLQRVGRAGHRDDQVSRGTIIATNADDALEAMTIARRAMNGDVEPAAIHDGSLDVLANQIASIVDSTDGIDARTVYNIVTRAFPFRSIAEETVRSIVRELADNRILRVDTDADRITPAGTWQYVYANLSMIPDEETYTVEDVASGSQVGTLDERFVATILAPGETFIQGGDVWRVVNIDDDDATVTVSPIEDPAGEVPSWIGQEIPVPEPVAREVGDLRDIIGTQLDTGGTPQTVARDVSTRYPAEPSAIHTACERIQRHLNAAPVPTATRIVIEDAGSTVRLNAPFGHEINETLGRMLASLLGQRVGSSVGLDTDPYRIELDVPAQIDGRTVKKTLLNTDPDHVAALIELTLDRSEALTFRLAQIAEHFGAVKPWRGDSRPSGRRLRDALEETPAYEEAKRTVIHEDLDIDGATAVIEEITTNTIELALIGGQTPIGGGGRSGGTELLAPENADASVVRAVKDRIESDRVRLLCVHCQSWERTKPVGRVRDQPQCPECGSTMIAALNPWDDETTTAVRTDEKTDDQDRRTSRAYQAASLVQAHGKQAVIALAARGVGPDTAARIINNHRETQDDFYRDILTAEREYARTKSFWE